MLDKKFFIKEGPIVRDKYRNHIFANAKDVNGKSFKGYSKEYGERKRANKFKRQSSKFAQSRAPVLTGDLLRDFGSIFNVVKNGFTMGWSKSGAIVESLKDRGRVLTEPKQPLPKGIIQYLSTKAHKYIDIKLGPNKTTIHRVGKK